MKRRIIVMLLLAAQAPAASRNDSVTAIDPSDKNILYTGRWYRADPSTPWCSWQGCSIIASFKGTSVSARLQAVAGGKDWVFVIIDDDRAGARTAPTGGSKPVYQIKVILQAGSGDTIDLNGVRMQKHSR